jgi:hypothetical protein
MGGSETDASGRGVVGSGDQPPDGFGARHGLEVVSAVEPPRYSRESTGSKLDPFKLDCDQLAGDPRIQSQRLREMAAEVGYLGGNSIFDDYVREVRPRFLVSRTFRRTVCRPGESI